MNNIGRLVHRIASRARANVWRSPQYRLVLVIALGVGLLGTYVLTATHATANVVATEPENGTITAPASQITDATASAGKAVKFETVSAGGARSCPAFPAFPDTSCTGVPAGYVLTTVSGSLSTSSNGQTIDGKLITGDLIVNNNNVTVTNTRIKGLVTLNGHTGLTLQDVDLGPDSCPASTGNYELIAGGDYRFVRVHAHNINADLIRLTGGGTVVLQDSLINQACYYAGDHLDAVQFYDPGGVGNDNIIHSSLDTRAVNTSNTGNSAVFWADNPGSGSRLTITQSKLAGGGFTTALYDANSGSGVIIDVNNNVYVKNSYQYGPCASSNSIPFNGTEGVKFTNNKYDDGTSVPGC